MKALFVATLLATSAALTSAVVAQAPSSQSLTIRCADFQRATDGSWTTIRQTLVPYPNGIVTMPPNTMLPAGTQTYMGFQVGRMLDEQCANRR